MHQSWITNGSNRVEPVVNPIAAACEAGYRPTDVRLLTNDAIDDITREAIELIKTVVTAAGGDEPAVTTTHLDPETDFDGIVAYLNEAIDAAEAADGEVAVDITPGRKFWSVISFQVGVSRDVDHLYYIHLDDGFFGESFPTIPRTAIELYDFTEEIDAR